MEEKPVVGKDGECPLSMLAMVSAKMLSNEDMDSQEDFDLSDQENVQLQKCFFTRNPERHRVLERARRGRLRSVMDELMSKLPEHLWQKRYPNKTKRSQIDVVNLAIEHIGFLEDLLSSSDKQLLPDPEKEKQDFDDGYRKCAEDLLKLARQNQMDPVSGCRDTRQLMHFIQQRAFPHNNSFTQRYTTSTSASSSSSSSKAPKRQFGDNNCSNGDPLQLSVFKRSKIHHQYSRVPEELNNNIQYRKVHKIRLHRPSSAARSDELSLLAPVNCQEESSVQKPSGSSFLTPASSPREPSSPSPVEILSPSSSKEEPSPSSPRPSSPTSA